MGSSGSSEKSLTVDSVALKLIGWFSRDGMGSKTRVKSVNTH